MTQLQSDMLKVLIQVEEYLRHPDVQALPFVVGASVPLRNVRDVIAKAKVTP